MIGCEKRTQSDAALPGTLLEWLPEDVQRHGFETGMFRLREYGANHLLHLAGDACSGLEIIVEGRVVIERIDDDGHLLTVASYVSGDLIGGNLVFSANPLFPLTITCTKPCKILYLEREHLFALLSRHPEFLRRYLAQVSEHAGVLGDRLSHVVNRSIREAVCIFLETEMRRQKTRTIRLLLTKKALAERIGVQRTSLSRELANMRRDGLIRYDSRTIEILY